MVRQEIELARPVDRKTLNRELEKAIGRGDKRYAKRLRAVLMKDEGKSNREIAQELSVTPRTIYRWIRLWNENGLERFRPQKPKGRAQKLSEDAWEEIKNIVNNKSPRDYGYDTDLWGTKVIKILIRDLYGVDYEIKYMYRLLRKKGVSSVSLTQRR
ncbi:MAG: helix-turn-helix domain-containing protein [Candidatus Njordarchaeum guaymaensis]